MTVRIDKSRCIGCGVCASICPQGFEMKGGKAEIKDENAPCVDKAANSCPNGAIILTGKEGAAQESVQAPQQTRPATGRGAGQGRGMGRGAGRGAGRNSGFGLGPSGECVCPKCGYKMPHERGTPCYAYVCPKCETRMTRMGS